jgi:hypothetical protein
MNDNAAKMSACSSNFGPDENLLCTIFFFFCNVKIKRGFENFFVGEKFKLFKSTKNGSFSSFFFRFLTQKSENMTVALLRRKNYSLLK